MKLRVLVGQHVDESGLHVQGEVFDSHADLAKRWPEKFARVHDEGTKVKKSALLAAAESLDIEVPEGATKAQIMALLEGCGEDDA